MRRIPGAIPFVLDEGCLNRAANDALRPWASLTVELILQQVCPHDIPP